MFNQSKLLLNYVFITFYLTVSYAETSSNQNTFCQAQQKLDSECATYCYNVVKPLLTMARECHKKDAEISKLKEQLAELQKKVAIFEVQAEQSKQQVKISEELVALNNKIEQFSQPFSLPNFDIISLYNPTSKESPYMPTKNNLNLDRLCRSCPNEAIKIPKILFTKNEPEGSQPVFPNSCLDTQNLRVIQTVQVGDNKPFRVACNRYLVGPGWMVIQQRVDGIIKFDQNWATYREGFGDLEGSFFIGLEKLHWLTKTQPHELVVYLESFSNRHTQAHYDNFQVGSEKEGYKLSLGNYTGGAGDAGNAMLPANNMKFSTYDRDNDHNKGSCSKKFYSGWWHNNCTMSNLNGFYHDREVKISNGIWWYPWLETRTLKSIRMLIKPK